MSGALVLDDERHRVHAEAGDAELQPEAHDAFGSPSRTSRVRRVEVGLEVVEAVEVPLARLRRRASTSTSARRGRPCPCSRRVGCFVDQTYQSRYCDFGSRRAAWNHGCWSDVWLTTRSTMTRMPRSLRLVRELDEVAERAEARIDAVVVGDVVAVVAPRRRLERQQPEAGDAQAGEVVEPARSGPRSRRCRRRSCP